MRAALAALAALALAGCDSKQPRTLPEGYVRLQDRMVTSMGLELLIPPCEGAQLGTIDRCYRMAESRRWKGVWANRHEGSSFCPNAKSTCKGHDYWLDWSGPAPSGIRNMEPEWQPMQIEFIGRRTAVPGAYGHFGLYKHYILVDRVIRAEPLPKDAEN